MAQYKTPLSKTMECSSLNDVIKLHSDWSDKMSLSQERTVNTAFTENALLQLCLLCHSITNPAVFGYKKGPVHRVANKFKQMR